MAAWQPRLRANGRATHRPYGEKDHQVPWAIAHATYKEQSQNPGVTEIAEIPGRGHSLTIDSGWQEVAQTCLDFIRRFA